MKRFILAFLAALVVVGGIVAVGVSLRPGDRSTDFFGWFDELDEMSGVPTESGNLVPIQLEDSLQWNREGEISIVSEVSDIVIVQGDSDQIEVQTTGKVTESIDVHLEIERKKNRIVVRLWQDRPEILMSNTTNLDTVITLPKEFSGDLDIETNVGDLDFGTYRGESLTVDSDVGDVEGVVEAEKIEIESNVGEVDVIVNGGEITLKTDVGELTFICDKADDLIATTDVGAIRATLSQDVVDLGIAADAGVGEVNSKVSFTEGKDSGAAIEIYAGVGEVKIYKQ